jgi:hypothetical protein
MDNLREGAPVGLQDRLERTISGIPDTEKERDDVIVGDSKDGAGLPLVAHRGVAGADAEIGGRDRHRRRRLPKSY